MIRKFTSRVPLLFSLAITSFASAQYYNISTVAGNGRIQMEGLGGSALNARLVSPRYAGVDASGNVYVSDGYYHQVFKIGVDGNISVAAGNGQPGFSGDSGQASAAQLNSPNGVAADAAGNLYIADTGNNRIRKVTPGGIISTFAGNGAGGATGDNAAATAAAIGGPMGINFDGPGNLFITQQSSNVVRQVKLDGTIITVAGNGTAGFSGDNAGATLASLSGPTGVAVDGAGNIYIADRANNRIRKVSQGTITTVAGNGTGTFGGDNGLATTASIALPNDVTLDNNGNLYIADVSNGRIRRVSGNTITTFASANLGGVNSVAFDGQGAIVSAAPVSRQVKRTPITGPLVTTTIGGILPTPGLFDNIQATATALFDPVAVEVDQSGNFYVSDTVDHRVRKVGQDGIITTHAGTGIFGNDGNGGLAANAAVGVPRGLALSSLGEMYIASGFGASVRKITPQNIISIYAGNNGPGFSGDGGPATAAQLLNPIGMVVDPAGNLFIMDSSNHRIRRVDVATKNITTFAGSDTLGFSGDNGAAIGAQLYLPRNGVFDSAGNLLFTDTNNHRIRKITPGGIISTIAGTGVIGGAGDGGPATNAQLNSPSGIDIDANNNIYVTSGNLVRKIDASSGIITKIAGNSTAGFSGDGGLATNAALDAPLSLAVDSTGNVYVADERNLRVRKLTPAQIVSEGVVNGGTFQPGAVAPGEIISIFGFNLGPANGAPLQLDANGKVALELGGTKVLFDGVQAPMIYSSRGQVNLVVPYSVAGKSTTTVQVIYNGTPTNTLTLPVVAASPGFFAVTNLNGSVNAANNPSDRNSVIVLYGTGEGQTNPAGQDGVLALSVYPKPVLPTTATVNGIDCIIDYSGAAPFFVAGVNQINIRLPTGVSGAVPLQVKFGSIGMPTPITIHIK